MWTGKQQEQPRSQKQELESTWDRLKYLSGLIASDLVGKCVLQEPGLFFTELKHTHPAKVLEKLKKDPGKSVAIIAWQLLPANEVIYQIDD